ncbi:MAG: redoxin domain-containing protein [Candidatus Hinthialibacter sp.]
MRQRRFLFVLCLAGVFTFTAAAEEEKIEPLAIGSPAPDFELPGVDGMTYVLNDFAEAKILTIIFTCNHCPTAQGYEDRIKRMVSEYTPKGVRFAAISPNDPKSVRLDELGYTDVSDSLEDMKIRFKHQKFNFPYLYDGDSQEISKKYGPTATPHVFVFDQERKLRYRGRIDDNERDGSKVTSPDLRNALNALLEGKPVPNEVTKPFGCSIKWSYKRDSVKDYFDKVNAEEVKVEAIDAQGIRELIANPTENYRLINVWATWCGPCAAEFPELVTIYRMYRKRPFEFITISADDPDQGEAVLKFLKNEHASNANYHYLSNDKDALVEAVDPEWQANIPYTILVKPGGGIIYRHAGIIDPLALKQEIVKHIGRTYASR